MDKRKMDNAESFLLQGSDLISDTGDKPLGLSNKKMNLFRGKYAIDSFVEDVMIKKKVNMRKESFDILKNWSHPIAVPLLNFYSESTNMGRVIIPPLDDTFKSWFKDKGVHILFDKDGHMTDLFRDFIIELCDMLQSLHLNGIVMMNNISEDDLYVKTYTSGESKIVLLLTEVKKSSQRSPAMKENWKSVQDFIDWCFHDPVKLHSDAEWFKKFIGKPIFSVEKLIQYPDTWDYTKKGQYLMSLKSANTNMIKRELLLVLFSWPKQLPKLLDQILDESTAKGYDYSTASPFDYLKILWDSYKHFEDRRLHRMFASREGFLKEVERWTENIWMKLYERIGWP